MHWYLKCLTQYFDFEGRARRKEYWMFYLFHIIFYIALAVIDAIIFDGEVGIFSLIYSLLVIIPFWAVGVRRLHDTGRSGWALCWGLFPFIGGFIVLYMTAEDSQPGKNQWGPNPKEKSPEEDWYAGDRWYEDGESITEKGPEDIA